MPSAFLSTFRKLHLYVHKTVQKHGITSILSYINIPTIRITTRFSLAKTYFQGNCLCSRWTVKKWNVQIISVRLGEGLLNMNQHWHFRKLKIKKKRVNSIYQLSLEFMLKSLPAWQQAQCCGDLCTLHHQQTSLFFSHNQFAKSLWSVRKRKKISCQFQNGNLSICPQKWSPYNTHYR